MAGGRRVWVVFSGSFFESPFQGAQALDFIGRLHKGFDRIVEIRARPQRHETGFASALQSALRVGLAAGMDAIVAYEARDVGLLAGQWIGLCIWIIGWDDEEEAEQPEGEREKAKA